VTATPGSSQGQDRARRPRGGGEPDRPRIGISLVALVIALAAGAAIFLLIKPLAEWALHLDSVVLLITGFVTVTLVLYLGTVVMTALGMPAPGEALGMPRGSIRALIAMVLILIFAIIGVVVFMAGTTGETYVSTGVTQNQVDAIRAGGGIVLEQDLMTASPAPGASPGESLYTVTIRPAMTQASHDFGLQLLTTVSTLVVAVAGFYFGSKNTGAAAEAARSFRPPAPQPPEVVPAVPEPAAVEGDEEDEGEDEEGGEPGEGDEEPGTQAGPGGDGGTGPGGGGTASGTATGQGAAPEADEEPGEGEPAELQPADAGPNAPPPVESTDTLDDGKP
jgi:hypothetical protein